MFRGSAYDGRPFWVRGGFRDGYYGRRISVAGVGFRLNGVNRGGSCELSSAYARSARHREMVGITVNSKIGFRWGVNGVYRGSGVSTSMHSNTVRSSQRRSRDRGVTGLSGVGFRSEW